MKKYYTITILILSLLLLIDQNNSNSQTKETKNHSIGLGTGLLSKTLLDELASPLKYSGISASVNMYYQYYNQESIHKLDILVSNLRLNPEQNFDYGDHFVDDFNLFIDYAYYRKIKEYFDEKLSIFFGGILHNYFSIRKHYYHLNMKEIYTDFLSSLNASFMARYHFSERTSVMGYIGFPVFTIIIRPPYSGRGSDSYKTTFLNSMSNLTQELSYEYILSATYTIQLLYKFDYYNLPQPVTTQNIQNIFIVRINLKL